MSGDDYTGGQQRRTADLAKHIPRKKSSLISTLTLLLETFQDLQQVQRRATIYRGHPDSSRYHRRVKGNERMNSVLSFSAESGKVPDRGYIPSCNHRGLMSALFEYTIQVGAVILVVPETLSNWIEMANERIGEGQFES